MDPYKVLGIEKGATVEEIKRAYRAKSKMHHPDMGGEEWIFIQVEEAYRLLISGVKDRQDEPVGAKADERVISFPEVNDFENTFHYFRRFDRIILLLIVFSIFSLRGLIVAFLMRLSWIQLEKTKQLYFNKNLFDQIDLNKRIKLGIIITSPVFLLALWLDIIKLHVIYEILLIAIIFSIILFRGLVINKTNDVFHDDDSNFAKHLILAMSILVVSLPFRSWMFNPENDPLKGAAQAQSGGISKEQLELVSQTLYGSWVEEDLFGNQTNQWSGSTGVLSKVDNNLVLITNSHCLGILDLASADNWTDGEPDVLNYQLIVEFPNGKRKQVLKFADSISLDLALLIVDSSDLVEGIDYVILPIDSSKKYIIGDEVVAVGSPLGFNGTQTFGRISAFRNNPSPTNHLMIQTDAAINSGNSGGPLLTRNVNNKYYWIGINTSSIKNDVGQGIGFAIDYHEALNSKYNWFSADVDGAKAIIRSYMRR